MDCYSFVDCIAVIDYYIVIVDYYFDHIGCCCCDIIVDCSGSCSNLPRYCIAQTRMLSSKIYFHCCNQWGCMARHFGCRCCRKNIKKIVPIKKNYTNNHIIIINPYDDNYKIGTISKTVNIV